ncbi:MAG: HAD family hydrolase [Crocinitomicaceae bacterium]
MNLNYEAIIFDLGGVILNINYHKTAEAFKELGVTNFDELYSQAQQIGIFNALEVGEIQPEAFYEAIRQMSGLPLSNSVIEAAWNAMLLDLPNHRVDLIKRIRDEVPIYLLSNTNIIHLKAFRKIIENDCGNALLLEDLFQKVYYSHEIGMRKPDANTFRYVLNQHHLSPQNTLFIDDSIQHIEGAKAAGIKAHHLVDGDIMTLFKSEFGY